jgi:hypothetical protein
MACQTSVTACHACPDQHLLLSVIATVLLQADMPDLVATVGRVCNCKVGPAGAVSGYLAFGSSMDFLYVAKRVPYPLTVEVYGGGGYGKLQPGELNPC